MDIIVFVFHIIHLFSLSYHKHKHKQNISNFGGQAVFLLLYTEATLQFQMCVRLQERECLKSESPSCYLREKAEIFCDDSLNQSASIV